MRWFALHTLQAANEKENGTKSWNTGAHVFDHVSKAADGRMISMIWPSFLGVRHAFLPTRDEP